MSEVDWEAIERDYRTGRYSLKELAEMHGSSKASISREAKKQGWTKDLSDAVRQRTREKVSRGRLSPEARDALDKSDAEIVEEAATENAAIVAGQRTMIDEWRDLNRQYATLLKRQLEKGEITVQLKNGDTAEIDIPLDYIGKSMTAGTQALERVIKLERQSYGLDEQQDDEGKTLEELLAEAAEDE